MVCCGLKLAIPLPKIQFSREEDSAV